MHPLLDLLDRNAVDRATRLAAADQSLMLDYRGFRAVAAGLAARLAAETGQPRVGILAPTSTACAVAVFACWYAGKTPVPLNFMLAPQEFGKIIRDAGLDLIVAIERFAGAAQAAGLRVLALNAQTLTPGTAAAPAAEPTDLGALIYTSGTAGDPKGVCLSFSNLLENCKAAMQAAEIHPEQNFLGLLPQFHAFGLTTTTILPLVMGATVHYLPRFGPVAVASTLREKQISVFITIASMYGPLAAMKDINPADFAGLTHPVSGGEPLPVRVAQRFEERFGRRILEGYGMTEASPVVSLNTPSAYRLGSVGRPLPGITVAAADVEGRTLPPGADGELIIRGHCVMQGYLNKPEQTAVAIRAGALWTGDVGHVDADGFIHITGRAKEMMIVGGENVFPSEIESVLLDHPGVAEAAVIGVRDDVRGEVPVAFVIPAEGQPPPEDLALRNFCRDRLASYKIPRQFIVEKELPRGGTGKILKRALKVDRS